MQIVQNKVVDVVAISDAAKEHQGFGRLEIAASGPEGQALRPPRNDQFNGIVVL